jgi:hypothetical protein
MRLEVDLLAAKEVVSESGSVRGTVRPESPRLFRRRFVQLATASTPAGVNVASVALRIIHCRRIPGTSFWFPWDSA